mgnify:CR=1 FL=1
MINAAADPSQVQLTDPAANVAAHEQLNRFKQLHDTQTVLQQAIEEIGKVNKLISVLGVEITFNLLATFTTASASVVVWFVTQTSISA